MCKCRFDLHYFSHTNETAFENNREVNNLFTSRSTLTDELGRLVFAELSDIEGLNISVVSRVHLTSEKGEIERHVAWAFTLET